MDIVKILYFILVVTNAGGEGKSLIAKLIKAIWLIGGANPEMLDSDIGNFTAKHIDGNAKVVGWGVQPTVAPTIVASTAGRHVVWDLGANAMASAREIADLVPAVTQLYRNENRTCIAFLPVSTNKDGAVGAINTLETKLTNFEKYVVKVDRDSSGNFDGSIQSELVLELGHLPPGFQMLIKRCGDSIAKAICEPPEGYKLAATYIAKWAYDFVSQAGFPSIFGEAVLSKLKSYSNTPGHLRFSVKHLSQTTDAALEENLKKSRIMDVIDHYGWTPDGLRITADKI